MQLTKCVFWVATVCCSSNFCGIYGFSLVKWCPAVALNRDNAPPIPTQGITMPRDTYGHYQGLPQGGGAKLQECGNILAYHEGNWSPSLS